ncbi:MAG: asparagine synthase (glutamine-hydrolyzing), partial [Firmicutes bacterium HGW-Firmicutes-12]
MCGISGWIDWNKDLTQQEAVINKMMAALIPRGPDDYGKWLSLHCCFGHRRLSVVDPVGGAQPMVRIQGNNKYVICYNGELYNTPELRSYLQSKNYKFQGHSDTEALLYSYMEWGPQCIERLNGIFAIAIWDESEQSLLLARDRMGVKPLFYAPGYDSLVFASELKAMLSHPEILPNISEEGLAEILIMGPARTPGHGIYEGLKEVRPGHLLIFNRNGLKVRSYWALTSQPHSDDLNTTAQKVKYLMKDTVERQLVSDVPVCTLLSGGLDSSTITAFASLAFKEKGYEPLHTYSIDYKDNDLYFKASEFQPNSDSPWANKVSSYLNTISHNCVIDTPQLVSALHDATLAKDLPGQADVDASLFLFCRQVKKGATVAL